MHFDFDLFFPFSLGLLHSLEADHIITVSSIALDREKVSESIKDGFYWGIGHLIVILIFGIFILGIKVFIPESIFKNAEILVGVLMILLGLLRVQKSFQIPEAKKNHSHNLSLVAGLVHGFSGSSLIMAIAFQYKTVSESFSFLLLFGLGSILSMTVASSLLKVFVNKKVLSNLKFKKFLMILSGVICLFYGIYLVYSI